jgi:hypothetical protein
MQSLVFAEKPQKEMFGVDNIGAAVVGLVAGEENHPPLLLRVSFKHRLLQLRQPIPSSSEDSSGVPQRRQITEEQSPQVSGSFTSLAQFGQ